MVDPAWFGGRLRELRMAAGLSRADLGQRAGMAGRSVEGLEQGRVLPGWATVVALCAALDVSPEAFMTAPAPLAEKPKGGRPPKVVKPAEKPKRVPARGRKRPKG